MIYVTTVWHSGTHSLIKHLGLEPALKDKTWIQLHCNWKMVEVAESGEGEIYTTWRDPREVAESWCKRKNPFPTDKWRLQWDAYAKIAPRSIVIPVTELGHCLNSDPRAATCIAPELDIEYAYLTVEDQRAKFVETYSCQMKQ